jgi:hypothetical protein
LRFCPQAEIRTDWAPKSEIVPWLAECKATAFAYMGANGGISGAVRLGLATGKPTVISQCRQFRDLLENYRDSVHVIEQPPAFSVADVRRALEQALAVGSKRPDRILDDMAWRKCAARYKSIYESLS